MSDFLQSLNPAQYEAVVNYQRPSLIIAGAGSGKTRVLTSRIAYMLEQGVDAAQILALTFTNKAAAEMRERIGDLIPGPLSRGLWMGTFHSIFARILREEADKLGYPSSFTIYDAADSKNLVKLAIKELELDEELYKPGNVASRISRAKNNLITVGAYEANTALLTEDRELRTPLFLEIYRLYTRRCRENGAMDFDDLLLNTNILLKDFPDVLSQYQERFRYILVDEYQDTNYAQYLIIRRLSERYGNVCVVGDDAQSIYSFRGAKIENILRFQQDFPQANLFKLEQNYRSTQTIVNAANSVIEKNQRQIRKHSFSAAGPGDLIKVIKAYTDREEASLIASEIYTTIRTQEVPYSEMAILYRTNAQSRALEEALRTRNIPYKIYGGFSFYQRKEIKDLLAYIRLVINPRDNEAFRRVINTPTRGIGDVTVGRIASTAQARGLSMWEAVSTLPAQEMELAGGAEKKVSAFARLLSDLSAARHTMEAHTLGLEIATRSGLIGSFKMQQGPEAISALENIEELINSIRIFTEEQSRMSDSDDLQTPVSIEEWMQNVALLSDMDNEKPEERNKVTLMTVHAAKGLEFSYVYVAGLEENLFPSLMSLGNADGLEEERRLFYVALTRAKMGAVLTFAESRFKWGEMSFSRPSRFLSEIDPQYLELTFELESTDSAGESERSTSRERKTSSSAARGGSGGYRSHSGGEHPYSGRESGKVGNSAWGNKPAAGSTAPGGRFRSMGRQRTDSPNPAPAEGISAASARTGTAACAEQGSQRAPHLSSPGATSPSATSPGATSPGATSGSTPYSVGMRVEHTKFGVGMITQIEHWSNDIKVTVDFGPMGQKVLLQKFAKLHIL